MSAPAVTGVAIVGAALLGWAASRVARWLDRHVALLLEFGLASTLRSGWPAFRRDRFGTPDLVLMALVILPIAANDVSPPALTAAGLTAVLGICSWLDWRHRILPDAVVLPLLGLGIILPLAAPLAVGPEMALAGAAIGWGMTSLVRLTGRRAGQGMGAGDVKLMAAIGAWTGPYAACLIFLAASIIIAIGFCWTKERGPRLPFGPPLAAATIACLQLSAVVPPQVLGGVAG